MSLLIPNARDHQDAHDDLDQDLVFIEQRKLRNSNVDVFWDFEPVDGFFRQSDISTDDMAFNYGQERFGIVTETWAQFMDKFNRLQQTEANPNVTYKLLFLARHGQGWHNVATKKYTSQEWMQKWRFLGTDGEIEWGPDANLTPLGIDQAKENNQLWKHQLQIGAPLPTKFYVSPLRRSSYTLAHTWEGIELPMKPIVVENVRETIGVHLCHKRATKSVIAERFPQFQFGPEFTEEDEIFNNFPMREKLHQQFMRVNLFMEEMFENDSDDAVISITSHAGTIRAFITAIGHRKFTIPTGGMIPIVVKGTKQSRHL